MCRIFRHGSIPKVTEAFTFMLILNQTNTCFGQVALIALLILILNFSSMGQSNWEIGMRLGNNVAADLTIPLSKAPRLHSAIYFDRFGLGEYFDWMFALSDGPAGLKFYPGFGPEFFFGNRFDFHIAGDFGAEYSFDFPLIVRFDWRPGFAVTESFRWTGDVPRGPGSGKV